MRLIRVSSTRLDFSSRRWTPSPETTGIMSKILRSPKKLRSASAVACNEDILLQILTRLPANALVQFKSVCKRWLFLISQPSFSLLHLRNSVPGIIIAVGCFGDTKYEYVDSYGKQTMNTWDMKVLHSSNGLLLCSVGLLFENKYTIYNPATKQLINLPELCDPLIPCGFTLAFDPSKSPHAKVFIVGFSDQERYHLAIYSTETGTWKFFEDFFTNSSPLDMGFHLGVGGVLFNGCVHWPSFRSETSLRFDVDRESLSTMPMPPSQDGAIERDIGYFGESGGHMHLIERKEGEDSTILDVLEMESDYSKWFLKYRVDLGSTTSSFPSYRFDKFSVLKVIVDGESEELSLILYLPGKVVSYKNSSLKKLCDLALPWDQEESMLRRGWMSAHQYTQTLFRLGQ